MFKRILIANRGEIAVRIIRACKEMGIQTVAVFSQADKNSPHLKLADKSVCIGPSHSSQSYLNKEAILQAALQNHCQAIHPGFGFLSENALFSALCSQYNITFIGPSPNAIKLMGDKSNARQTMKQAGLPIIPGSDQVIPTLEEAQKIANEIGFPVLLKATAGGGGKGMRICQNPDELDKNFIEASCEAEKAFGNKGLYMERYLIDGRHIEFQVISDSYGNAVHLGERECSVQRNHQKLLEESPSCAVTPEQRVDIGSKIAKAVRMVGYQNAGTMEFFMEKGNLYFMEMNTRIQVEHPVTEMVTQTDIVKEQIRIAANHILSWDQSKISFQGHAIECRINAENPDDNFRPSPGQILRFQPPGNIGTKNLRLDTFVEEGYTIPSFYDSMIGKLIAWGENREEAIAILKKALEEFVIEIGRAHV